MTKRNPREILAELIKARNVAGANLHARLKLADELLSNKEWVEDPSGGGGDASRAIDRLERDCFGPEAGMSLPEMLEVLAAIPQESVWKQNHYNIKKMWLEMKERQRAVEQSRAKPERKAPAGAAAMPSDEAIGESLWEDENRRLKAELKEARIVIRNQEAEIKRLRKAIKKLQGAFSDLQTIGA